MCVLREPIARVSAMRKSEMTRDGCHHVYGAPPETIIMLLDSMTPVFFNLTQGTRNTKLCISRVAWCCSGALKNQLLELLVESVVVAGAEQLYGPHL